MVPNAGYAEIVNIYPDRVGLLSFVPSEARLAGIPDATIIINCAAFH